MPPNSTHAPHRHAMRRSNLANRVSPPGWQRPGWRLAGVAGRQAGLAYWAAASWGGWISLSKDDPDVVADLPLAVRLAQRAWAADPAWGRAA